MSILNYKMEISNKKSVIYLISLCKQLEINQIVVCPGSRNLPLILSFTNDPYFICHSCIDERAAGFLALGIIKASQKPAIVITTSGSAAINLAPAMAEAFYLNLPLIAITADRPKEWINKGENQTIIQNGLFANYVQYELEIDENISFENFDKRISTLIKVLYLPDYKGNVHINMPFSEPLIKTENIIGDFKFSLPNLNTINKELNLNFNDWIGKNVLIYLSSHSIDKELVELLDYGIDNLNWIVISDIYSNYNHPKSVYSIDLIFSLNNIIQSPDILITIGEQMLSKKARYFFKTLYNLMHIDVNIKNRNWNSISHDYKFVKASPIHFLKELIVSKSKNKKDFAQAWQNYQTSALQYHNQFFSTPRYSEFCVTNFIMNHIEEDAHVYWGNSSLIRYANWCKNLKNSQVIYLSNRGASGIEGVLSSAIGYQVVENKDNYYCILGDISFLYELGSLHSLKEIHSIKIIVFNNHGGKIFDNIHNLSKGNKKSELMTPQNYDLSLLAKFIDIEYFKLSNLNDFISKFTDLKYKTGKYLIEIDFPENSNLDWKKYFDIKI